MHLKELLLISFVSAFVTLFFSSIFISKEIQQSFEDKSKMQQAQVELIRSEIKEIIEDKKAIAIAEAFKGRDCGVCHYKGNNELPKTKIRFKYFECYMRGTCRWGMNPDVLPNYPKERLSDTELRSLYEAIYH